MSILHIENYTIGFSLPNENGFKILHISNEHNVTSKERI